MRVTTVNAQGTGLIRARGSVYRHKRRWALLGLVVLSSVACGRSALDFEDEWSAGGAGALANGGKAGASGAVAGGRAGAATSGGGSATGGLGTGGRGSGGVSTGGVSTGGVSTGGVSTGGKIGVAGKASGGAASGGKAGSGGTTTGGGFTGGAAGTGAAGKAGAGGVGNLCEGNRLVETDEQFAALVAEECREITGSLTLRGQDNHSTQSCRDGSISPHSARYVSWLGSEVSC